MNVEIVESKEIWNSILDRSSNGTLFHDLEWLKISARYATKNFLGKRVPCKFYPLVVFKGEEPIGALPAFMFKHAGIKLLLSPPHGVENYYLGPLFVEFPNAKRSKIERYFLDFWKAIDEYVATNFSPSYILIHTSPGILDARPFKWCGYYVEPRYTYVVDLNRRLEDVWLQLSRSLRRDIKKAWKIFEIRSAKLEDLSALYDIMRKRGRIHCSLDYLGEIFKTFNKNIVAFVAEFEGEVVSGIVNLIYRNRVQFWIGLPRVDLPTSPNGSLLWSSIEWAKAQGYGVYEIMSAEEYELFPFKSKFNANLEIYFSVRKFGAFARILSCIREVVKGDEVPR